MSIPLEKVRYCKCGHAEASHFFTHAVWPFSGSACSGQVDLRPLTAGGSDLSPCPCKGWEDVMGDG